MAWTVRPQGQTSVTPRPSDGAAHVAAPTPKPQPRGAAADQDAEALVARFWGVRGSYATPRVGGGTVGGDTTCLELRYGRQTLIIDAGSGIIALGEDLMRRANATSAQPQAITLLLTHAHHDHLCGLPFFAPLYDPRFHIHFFGPDLAGMRFEDIIAGYMRAPYFPVDFRALPSRRTLTSLSDGARVLIPAHGGSLILADGERASADALLVETLFTQLHPSNGTMLYRITADAARLVFATDVEVRGQDPEAERRLIEFARGADVLIHDAQYSEEDYDGADPKRGYGHSTPTMAVRVARGAQVGRLALFHHDPHYDDQAVAELERRARAAFPDVITAREGLELRLDGARRRLV